MTNLKHHISEETNVVLNEHQELVFSTTKPIVQPDCITTPDEFQNLYGIRGGLRKISSPEIDKPCLSSEHNPPSMIVLSPGTYEYTCPSCGKITIFTVPLITI